MKDFIAKFIRGQRGFSLVQTLVGAGIIGGLSLVAAQLTKQGTDNKLVQDANYGIVDLTGRIQTLISNNASCTRTFLPPFSLANNLTTNVGSLKNGAGADIFVQNGKYSNDKVRINAMTLTRTDKNSVLSVTMEKMIAGKTAVANVIKKDFFINAVWSGNNLSSCASDITNFIDTVAAEALSQACPVYDATTAPAEGLVRDGDKCRANFQMRVNNTVLECPAGSDKTIVGLDWDNTTKIYKPICRNVFAAQGNLTYTMPNCGANELLKRNADGTFACVPMTCPLGQVPVGFSPTGLIQCLGCPGNQIMVATTSGWQCRTTSCLDSKNASQQYFAGFAQDGSSVCFSLIDQNPSPNCPGGGNLTANASGNLTFSCCSPQCADAANYCSGTAFASTNSCGSCSGTKAADCSNSNLFCTGTTNPSVNGCGTCPGTKPADCSNNGLYCNGQTYTSANGCGTCTGSKPAANATWSAWAPTSTYVAKSGSTCSKTCGGGTQAAQRKYIRTCSNDQSCGGSTCVGASEEYRDEGTIACNEQVCSCTPSCTVAASSICKGSTFTEADDCGGNCPTLVGTSAFSAPSIKCMYDFDDSGGGTTGGSTTGGGCFIAGTQVAMADGAYKNIEDILVGDKLVDGSKKIVTVQKLIPLDYQGEIFGINGGGYFFTPNHPFKTLSGWKSLDPVASNKETPGLNVTQMRVGDILIKKNGLEVIYSLDSIPANEKVYNFELNGSHEYVADEFVVHNKLACPSCSMGQWSSNCPEYTCPKCIDNGDPAPNCL